MPPVERQPDSQRRSLPNTWWRSLDQLADTPRFREFLEAEFPAGADPGDVNRRAWLKMMGASLALASAAGCRWDRQDIVPFDKRPEGRTPGRFRRFSTAMALGDSAIGLQVTTVDGRPIKIEGNPNHPQSLGATDVLAQAAILELYDPDRSGDLWFRAGDEAEVQTWEQFDEWARSHFSEFQKNRGAGLRVLAEASSSAALDLRRKTLLDVFPQAKWLEFEPLGDDNERAGAVLAFGEPAYPHLALDAAQVVVCIDADPLGEPPESVRLAHDFAAGRGPSAEGMNRLYVVEPGFTITGAAADHRLPLRSTQIPALVALLEREAAAGDSVGTSSGPSRQLGDFVRAMASDLQAHRGRGVVCVGPGQPPEVHAAVHRINAKLGNAGKTVTYLPAFSPTRPLHIDAIRTLVEEIEAGDVTTLVILGGNPIYNAPADMSFKEALDSVETTIHLSLYRDETSRSCTWHLPRAHFLESWGDVRSRDGTQSIVQPMVAPLRNGRSPLEFLGTIAGSIAAEETPVVPPEESMRELFRSIVPEGISWQATIRDGLAVGLGGVAKPLTVKAGPPLPEELPEGDWQGDEVEIIFRRDASVHDGRFANNSWLQEFPDPITKLTWDNAALLGPATGERLGVKNETLVTLAVDGRQVEIPAFIVPGVAPGSVVVSLGYGRTAAGRVGGDIGGDMVPVGTDVYPLRTSDSMHVAIGATLAPTGREYPLAGTQDHHAIDTVGRAERDKRAGVLIREATLDHYREHPDFARHAVHHPPLKSLWKELSLKGHRWGMSIDLSKCTGCGACVVACQAENNVPVVGKKQVRLGREMHWLRVDRYFQGDPNAPRVAQQPLPCQQCELAPCEQVCPVAATTHTEEGLNDMVYNRCVGTRYCANNCPYKVRRFNYFNFHKDLGNPDNEISKMQYNPQVTVRSRGVMEKCTYCVQRIQAAKIEAKNAGRSIDDGEIRTACQQVCPAGAIVFGDLADEQSEVAALLGSQRAYGILAELNIRPRTAYLARIRNPNPHLEHPEHEA